MCLSYNSCCCNSNLPKAISEKIHSGLESKVQGSQGSGGSRELDTFHPWEERKQCILVSNNLPLFILLRIPAQEIVPLKRTSLPTSMNPIKIMPHSRAQTYPLGDSRDLIKLAFGSNHNISNTHL